MMFQILLAPILYILANAINDADAHDASECVDDPNTYQANMKFHSMTVSNQRDIIFSVDPLYGSAVIGDRLYVARDKTIEVFAISNSKPSTYTKLPDNLYLKPTFGALMEIGSDNSDGNQKLYAMCHLAVESPSGICLYVIDMATPRVQTCIKVEASASRILVTSAKTIILVCENTGKLIEYKETGERVRTIRLNVSVNKQKTYFWDAVELYSKDLVISYGRVPIYARKPSDPLDIAAICRLKVECNVDDASNCTGTCISLIKSMSIYPYSMDVNKYGTIMIADRGVDWVMSSTSSPWNIAVNPSLNVFKSLNINDGMMTNYFHVQNSEMYATGYIWGNMPIVRVWDITYNTNDIKPWNNK